MSGSDLTSILPACQAGRHSMNSIYTFQIKFLILSLAMFPPEFYSFFNDVNIFLVTQVQRGKKEDRSESKFTLHYYVPGTRPGYSSTLSHL